MYIATEVPPPRSSNDAKPRLEGDAPIAECDFCGRPVRRETAFQRAHRRHDGVELVPLCRECELGTD